MAEAVKKPHELMVGKLYPLTLDTFTRVRLIFIAFRLVLVAFAFTDYEFSVQYVQHITKYVRFSLVWFLQFEEFAVALRHHMKR